MWTDLRVSASPVRSNVSEIPVSSRCASNRPDRSKVPMYSLSGYSSATSALSGIGLVIDLSTFPPSQGTAARSSGNDLDQNRRSREIKEKHQQQSGGAIAPAEALLLAAKLVNAAIDHATS